ncbi:MAG: hypothetical protein HY865_03340 [Chloroflexi bacterium]|nr:hypothetical protein [Chloroflexota bacterium]
MRKILVALLLLFVLMTSACGAQAPVETAAPSQTASPTLPATATPTAATETPSATASITPTLETAVPTNPPDCINSAAFVTDVTIADNELMLPGTTFTKTWRIKNTGTCVWGPAYTLTHYSEERMLAPASVPLSVTYPDQTADISVTMTAPSADGKHKGFFVIKNPAGLIMKIDNDSRLWVLIDVSSALASLPTEEGSIPVTGNGFADVTCGFTADSARVTDVIVAVNAYRAQNGLPAYILNEKLTQSAGAHANDMACNNFFTHTGSNGSTPPTRVAASGYSAALVTENVYGSYPPLSGQGAVDWWKNDKTDVNHNLNLLSTTFTEFGVGYSFFNNYGYYVVVFAKPK